MGLDITAYKNLKEVEKPTFDEFGELENWETQWIPGDSMKWSEKHFPGRGEGVNPDGVYEWDDSYSFRAGSYFGYGWWRNKLSEFKGFESDDFKELINFADNEGVIGGFVSCKLFKDFSTNVESAVKYSSTFEEGKSWLQLYFRWMTAFGFASQSGAVAFH